MKISSFSKSYGSRTVLRFPDLELPDGRITAVIGPNGSGKSTLARVLAGIERSDQKRPLLTTLSVGYMPQKSYAFRMSVARNLYMPQKSYAFRMSVARNLALNGSDTRRREKLLCGLQIDALARQSARRLSGGETAKMALARLLMRDYELLILDEPTAAMDVESTLAAEALLSDYCRDTGAGILLVTHSLQQARRIAQHVLFLHRGELREQGAASQLLSSPGTEELRRFLEFYGI